MYSITYILLFKITKCFGTKITLCHIDVVTKPRTVKLYLCIVVVNIIIIDIKYSYRGPNKISWHIYIFGYKNAHIFT